MHAFLRSTILASVLTSAYAQYTPQSCDWLSNTCNKNVTDLNNVWNSTACAQYALCQQNERTPASVLQWLGAPTDQPRLTQSAFSGLSQGADTLTNDTYSTGYQAAVKAAGGTYDSQADDRTVNGQYLIAAAWTNSCDGSISYSSLADWFEHSSNPGTCPAVTSCDGQYAALNKPCGTQPAEDNGSCKAIRDQCEFWITQGAWQNEYCALGAMCSSAEGATPDVMIRTIYPTYVSNEDIPTAGSIDRLSTDAFHNMTGGADTMSLQNAIDAYYGALTNTWTSLGGPFGAESPSRSGNNGPYPTSSDYITGFWKSVAAWTGNCDTLEIGYDNLADWFQYSSDNSNNSTC
ncbi:hypothetical protein CONPUDRAFT_139359 [Coniophora puteana RWD-64-598 SS2]|uniref:Uncharacterized protein n=1 Tax=Coniophora puteana (strain RWD-64-598) TaxID=741705 RepID=A0A5M3MC30_CONPW|nr:uncharacterized protein CONPUDRAFT_139359 [Coniophora puteana RWD-64-598 SS2]EIW76586.1 hypothetical protein CONPUDRAFT_139359 [Coniophora puteana RWD-64-598 SS2]